MGLITGLIVGLIHFGIGLKITTGLFVGLSEGSIRAAIAGLIVAPIWGMFQGLIFGLLWAMIGGLCKGWPRSVIGGLILGAIYHLIMEKISPGSNILYWPLFLGLLGGIIVGLGEKVRPVEILGWSWKQARFYGLRTGVVIGILFVLVFLITLITEGASRDLITQEALSELLSLGLDNEDSKGLILAVDGLFLWFFGLLFGFPFGAVIGGIAGPSIDIEKRTIPNQGIWQSAANAGIIALIGGGLVFVVYGLIIILKPYSVTETLSLVLYNLIPFLIISGLICTLVPGFACIQHFSLRAVLCWRGLIPWDYARFLNYATEKMLLQRVGGRYRFIHDLLREHFAQM